MARFSVLFALLCFISSPAFSQDLPETDAVITPFYHNVVFYSGFTETRKAKVMKAMDAIVEVVQTQAFKDAVLRFKDQQGELRFNENRGLSNQQIYDLLITGSERLRPTEDQTMDLTLTWYHKHNSTVGYTYASSTRTWINGHFHDYYTTPQMARNLFHEWTHKMGFGHVTSKSKRPWTVPYGLGKVIEKLLTEKMERGEL